MKKQDEKNRQSVRDAIDAATRIVGTRMELALKLGISRVSLWQYHQKGKLPKELAISIEKLTNGRVSRHELAPTDFPPTAKYRPRCAECGQPLPAQ